MSFLKGATVGYDIVNNKAVYVDQTLLPSAYVEKSTDSFEEMYDAIKKLRVRGAPAIGVFTAISIAVLINKAKGDYNNLLNSVIKLKDDFIKCRPTAVNLKWAAERMVRRAEMSNGENIKCSLKDEALQILDEDVDICRKIGINGAELLSGKSRFLTHCNAGRLAAVKYGTALAPIYVMAEQGKSVSVYADETRPLLQGARLTAYELTEAGINTTVICDNMASYVMKNKLVDAVLVGCDRVALNGDFANKIGTSGVAVLAKYYNIPFYVCMPFSTFDSNIENGSQIIIEQRRGAEVTSMWYEKPMVTDKANVLNPAFDVTDNSLVTAFITEKGVIEPASIRKYF